MGVNHMKEVTFGTFLKQKRLSKEYTLRGFAEMMGVSQVYAAQYAGYADRHDAAKAQVQDLEWQMAERKAQREVLAGLIRAIERQDVPAIEFDDVLWMEAVEKVTVRKDGKLVFTFKDATKVTV